MPLRSSIHLLSYYSYALNSLRGSEERGNMLRFKIEVMVQMLAVEEKQNQSLLKRLEASKFLALSHGY